MKRLPKIIAVIGATASGKTKFAVELARLYNGETISADSRQVYKGMDIGTGKDLMEYGKGKNQVKYHLIDVIPPSKQFDLKTYQTRAYKAISGVLKRKKLPIIVGGSGLYLQAVIDGYALDSSKSTSNKRKSFEKLTLTELQSEISTRDPNFFNKLSQADQKNKRRLIRYLEILQSNMINHSELYRPSKPRYEALVFGLEYSLPTLRKRIKKRLDSRFKEGMIEEVEHLHNEGLSWEKLESFGLEYKYISLYLQKNITKEEMKKKLEIASGQFAKRQLTWFRRWEKQGREILWLKAKDVSNRRFSDTINRFLTKESNVRRKNNVVSFK